MTAAAASLLLNSMLKEERGIHVMAFSLVKVGRYRLYRVCKHGIRH
jgi:hypothetical protein